MRNLDSLRAQARAFDAKQQAEGLPRQMTLCAEPRPATAWQPVEGSIQWAMNRGTLYDVRGGHFRYGQQAARGGG